MWTEFQENLIFGCSEYRPKLHKKANFKGFQGRKETKKKCFGSCKGIKGSKCDQIPTARNVDVKSAKCVEILVGIWTRISQKRPILGFSGYDINEETIF